MDDDTQRTPDGARPDAQAEDPAIRKTEIDRLCDEQSGGGGSNPDTRYRGMPGGYPGGPLDGDCEPVSRAEPDGNAPTPAGKTP